MPCSRTLGRRNGSLWEISSLLVSVTTRTTRPTSSSDTTPMRPVSSRPMVSFLRAVCDSVFFQALANIEYGTANLNLDGLDSIEFETGDDAIDDGYQSNDKQFEINIDEI